MTTRAVGCGLLSDDTQLFHRCSKPCMHNIKATGARFVVSSLPVVCPLLVLLRLLLRLPAIMSCVGQIMGQRKGMPMARPPLLRRCCLLQACTHFPGCRQSGCCDIKQPVKQADCGGQVPRAGAPGREQQSGQKRQVCSNATLPIPLPSPILPSRLCLARLEANEPVRLISEWESHFLQVTAGADMDWISLLHIPRQVFCSFGHSAYQAAFSTESQLCPP